MTSLLEQETTVTYSRADGLVHIYSSIPSHVRRMRKDSAYTEVRSWGDDCGEFTIDHKLYDPMRGRRRPRAMTDEQKKASAERLRVAREKRALEVE